MAKTQVVGLDIGDTQLRAVEMALDPRDPVGSAAIERYAEVDLPPDAVRDGEVVRADDVSAAIKRLWSSHRLASKDVVIGLGGQRVVVREATLPAAPLDALRLSLPYTVQDLIMVPVDECQLDFYPLAEADGQVSGLLVAAPRETIGHNVDAVLGAGLRPVRVDLAAFALTRALARGQFGQGIVGIVDVGADMTTVVVAQSGQPVIMRILPTGGRLITDQIARTLGVPELRAEQLKVEVALMNPGEGNEQAQGAFVVIAEKSQALVEQVARTFSFYAQTSGQAVGHVVISGRGGMLNGLGQYISTALRLPASFSVLDSAFAVSKSARAMTAEQRMSLPVAVGLAMGAAA
ncbi:MAG: type IV pilus assembly protein PilM [Bifidobacteriaceae bacterium]|jgi:type IV pilus assembly protein PilM|nr:type IV pilus assembly protein PilM [Bifidobacteriaceae bacterium]